MFVTAVIVSAGDVSLLTGMRFATSHSRRIRSASSVLAVGGTRTFCPDVAFGGAVSVGGRESVVVELT